VEWYPITGRTCELQRVLDQNQGAMQLVACVDDPTSGVLYLHNTYEPEGSDEVDSVWHVLKEYGGALFSSLRATDCRRADRAMARRARGVKTTPDKIKNPQNIHMYVSSSIVCRYCNATLLTRRQLVAHQKQVKSKWHHVHIQKRITTVCV